MQFTSFSSLRDWRLAQLRERWEMAKSRGWPRPCSVCWPDPEGYAKVGHICDLGDRRNHSSTAIPSSGHVVEFRAVSNAPMDDETLSKHLHRPVHVYGGYKWQ